MKKTLAALAALLVTVGTYGQGTLTFNNRVIPDVDAKVSNPDGTGVGAGFTAQLYIVNGTSLTAITPSTTFRTASAAAFYYVNDPGVVTVNGVAGGASVTLRMRAFNGADYASSTIRGESNDFTIVLGGAGSPPSTPATLIGLQGFSVKNVAVPEPTTIALGVLGLGALLIRRRK